jgi:Arc/MetJ-type ribon-helix-helix transcriptional regulator
MIFSYPENEFMRRTVKFTVSVPEPVFKELEARRRRTRMSRSQVVREAVGALGAKTDSRPAGGPATGEVVREDPALYGIPAPSLQGVTDAAERRRRAIAAAGRFRSGTNDLSTEHDARLEEAYAAGSGKGAPSPAGSKRKP